ncbi:MAG: FAD-dependent oxidoreductase [Lentisphaerae bacterium]|nr:FAD-dependent oxidoreductase [Lentisphaerota bacterium]
MKTAGVTPARVRYLIAGAGVSGLGFANFAGDADYLILEREPAVGGYCRTVRQAGFTWDYSGHFLHLRDEGIRRFFADRTDPAELMSLRKRSHVYHAGRLIDFPFQKNIHQLPWLDYVRCLVTLLLAPRRPAPANLSEHIEAQAGREISRLFLRPYNEKLYQCALQELAPTALGRFFPAMTAWGAVSNALRPDNRSYNDTFQHPRGGIAYYVDALCRDLDPARIRLGEAVVRVDLARRVATTSCGAEIAFEHLISTAPLPVTLALCGVRHPADAFTHSKVVVINLGFDRPGTWDTHWVYVADRALAFYRIGFYDRIYSGDRMSLYVECAFRPDVAVDVEALRARVLRELAQIGVVTDQRLVAWHAVEMDPAYVHIRPGLEAVKAPLIDTLRAHHVHPLGRYGRWTYCSIEDNLIEARALAAQLK